MERRAANGDAEAQHWMAALCFASDRERSIQNYALSAQQGHAGAQFELGALLFNGESIDKDQEAGLEYMRLAAQQGHAAALKALRDVGLTV